MYAQQSSNIPLCTPNRGVNTNGTAPYLFSNLPSAHLGHDELNEEPIAHMKGEARPAAAYGMWCAGRAAVRYVQSRMRTRNNERKKPIGAQKMRIIRAVVHVTHINSRHHE